MPITHRQAKVIGPSKWAVAMRNQIAQLAPHDQSCLIVGPPSSGRTFLTRVVHQSSTRSEGPFVPVRCEVLPGKLFSTQVFGCAPGVMSSSSKATLGAARAAEGGTLFLRHVDQLDALAQWELLGFLTQHEVSPVGSRHSVPVEVRVCASCSSDIHAAVRSGQFDADLYQRLAGSLLETVDLTERSDDIVPLAMDFLHEQCARLNVPEKHLEPSAIEWLLAQEWPGNLGSLRTLMEGLAADEDSSSIDHETIELWLAQREPWPSLPR